MLLGRRSRAGGVIAGGTAFAAAKHIECENSNSVTKFGILAAEMVNESGE